MSTRNDPNHIRYENKLQCLNLHKLLSSTISAKNFYRTKTWKSQSGAIKYVLLNYTTFLSYGVGFILRFIHHETVYHLTEIIVIKYKKSEQKKKSSPKLVHIFFLCWKLAIFVKRRILSNISEESQRASGEKCQIFQKSSV